MRFITLALLSVSLLLVSAQTFKTDAPASNDLLAEAAKLPSCVTGCIAELLPNMKCALTDLACLCSDKEYAASSGKCIMASCSVKDALLAQRWQAEICPVPEHNAGPLTAKIGIFLLVVGAVCVGCRFLARWRIQNSSIGWDDWSILVSYVLLIPSTVLIEIMAHNGMGRDIWTVPFDNITLMLKVFYIEQFCYQVVVCLTKISIVLLYLRIFPKEVSRRFAYISWTIIGALTAYALAFIIYFTLECQPISYFWNQWDGEHEGQCNDFQLASYINGGLNIFFDLVVFFLPIPKLLKLHVRDKRRKVGAILTFLVGIFVTVCSVIRLTYLAQVGKYTNATYHYNDVGTWTGVEAYLGVICACMPSIVGPLIYFFNNTVGSKFSSSSKTGGSQSRNTLDEPAKRNYRVTFEDEDEEVEMGKRDSTRDSKGTSTCDSKSDGPGETNVTALYGLPTNSDDVELIHHDTLRGAKDQHGGVRP